MCTRRCRWQPGQCRSQSNKGQWRHQPQITQNHCDCNGMHWTILDLIWIGVVCWRAHSFRNGPHRQRWFFGKSCPNRTPILIKQFYHLYALLITISFPLYAWKWRWKKFLIKYQVHPQHFYSRVKKKSCDQMLFCNKFVKQ